MVRATFRQEVEDSDKLPLISIGTNKAIQAVKMPEHTVATLQLHEMIDALVQNYINAVLAEMFGKEAPQPDRGLVPEVFEATLDCLEFKSGTVFVKDNLKVKFASLWKMADSCICKGGILKHSLDYCLKLALGEEIVTKEVSLMKDSPDEEPASKKTKHDDFIIKTNVSYSVDKNVSQLLQERNPKNLMSIHCLPTTHLNAAIHGSRRSAGFKAHQDADRNRGCDMVSNATKTDE